MYSEMSVRYRPSSQLQIFDLVLKLIRPTRAYDRKDDCDVFVIYPICHSHCIVIQAPKISLCLCSVCTVSDII